MLITEGPDTDSRFALQDRIRIGREADNEVCLPRREISRHHAMLELFGEDVQLVDMGSSNGTFVDGQRITHPVTLGSGDTFVIHDSQFTVLRQGVQPSTERTCSRCGASVRPGNRFCSACGSQVV